MTERPFVFIATPCFGGLLGQGYVQSLVSLMQYGGAMGIDMTLGVLGHDALITRSRNTLLSAFINDTQATHLLFIDADISFDPTHVKRLIDADKDVVAGMYPLKTHDWSNLARLPNTAEESLSERLLHYVGGPLDEADDKADGAFRKADFAGTGFMMIRRCAVERMIAAYPEAVYRTIHAFPVPKETRPQYALFECLIDNGIYLSEDYAFCHRWRAIGGEVWLDTEGRLTHTGGTDFIGNPATRYAVA